MSTTSTGGAVNVTLSTSSQAIGGIKVNTPYLISSDTACWLNWGSAAAVGTGFYIPANTVVELAFHSSDVRVIAGGAGKLSMLPGGHVSAAF